MIQRQCFDCRQKKPNPEAKIYNERTIEVGILVDSYLWENMKVYSMSNYSEALRKCVTWGAATPLLGPSGSGTSLSLSGSGQNNHAVLINLLKVLKLIVTIYL